MIRAHHSRVQILDLAHFCGKMISLSLRHSNYFSSNEQLCIETHFIKEWKPCRMDGRGFRGLPVQPKQASKGEKEAEALWRTALAEVYGNSHQDGGGRVEVSKTARCFTLGRARLEGGSQEQVVGIIQETDNKRQESGRC